MSRLSLRTILLAVMLAAAARMAEFAAPDFVLDDAWISFRIARNWLHGAGLTYDPTRPAAEGMTNFLWTILSAAWIKALPHTDPIVVARIAGAVCQLGAAVATALLSARLASARGADGRLAAAVGGGLFAISGSLAFHALSGLETASFTLLAVSAMSLAGDARGARWPWLFGAILCLLELSRPEGVLIAALLCAFVAVRRVPRWTIPVALFAAVALLHAALRLRLYGAILPNTFAAKPPDSVAGLRYAGFFAVYGLGIVGVLAAIPALRDAPGRAVAIVGAALAVGVIWSGGDWMPGFRRFAVPFAAFCSLAGAGVAAATGSFRKLAWAGVAAAAVASFAASLRAVDAGLFITPAWRSAALAAAATPGVSRVAANDIGCLGWYFPGSVFDFAGLTDAHIAHLPGTLMRKRWDEDYFRAAHPDLILVNQIGDLEDSSVHARTYATELAVLRSVREHGGYRPAALWHLLDDKYLLVLAREGLTLPTEIWGPPPRRQLDTLVIDDRDAVGPR